MIPVLVISMVVVVSATYAKGPLDGEDLGELVDFALATHPSLQFAEAQKDAATERIRQVGSLPDPMFMWGEMVEGPAERMLTLTQTFPWPGTLAARRKAALSIADAAGSDQMAAAVKVAAAVRRAWAGAAWLAEMRDLLVAQQDLARDLESSVRAAYEAGTGRYGDLLQAQLEVARRSDQLAAIAEDLTRSHSDLNAALGRKAGAPLTLPRRLVDPQASASAEAMISMHPALAALDRRADAQRHESVAAARAGRPALSLGIDWISMSERGMAPAGAMSNAVRAKFGLSLPVWRGKFDGAVAAAKAQARSIEAERLAGHRFLEARLQTALSRLRDAQRRRELYERELLPLARQAYETSLAGYRADWTGFVDVLTAQRSLLDLQEALLSVRRDQLIAAADIDETAGTLPQTNLREPRSGS